MKKLSFLLLAGLFLGKTAVHGSEPAARGQNDAVKGMLLMGASMATLMVMGDTSKRPTSSKTAKFVRASVTVAAWAGILASILYCSKAGVRDAICDDKYLAKR